VDAHNGGAKAQKMKARRVSRPVVADSHNFDEEQDPDPNLHTHISEKLAPDADPH
jgi:hypothetical protein